METFSFSISRTTLTINALIVNLLLNNLQSGQRIFLLNYRVSCNFFPCISFLLFNKILLLNSNILGVVVIDAVQSLRTQSHTNNATNVNLHFSLINLCCCCILKTFGALFSRQCDQLILQLWTVVVYGYWILSFSSKLAIFCYLFPYQIQNDFVQVYQLSHFAALQHMFVKIFVKISVSLF